MNKKISIILMLSVFSLFAMSSPRLEEIETLLNNGLTDTAEKLVQKLLQEHPDDLQLNYYLSVVYYQQKNFGKLAKQVDRCITLLESSIATEASETARMKFKISFYKGSICLYQGNLKEAGKWLSIAQNISNDDLDLHQILVQYYCQTGECGNAEKEHNWVFARKKDSTDLVQLLSNCYTAKGEKEECVRIWKDVISRNPRNSDNYIAFTNELVAMQMWQEAWYYARIAFLLTRNSQIESLLKVDLPSELAEPENNKSRAEEYVKKFTCR